jgi:4-hydroxybenzoate polyprenyltransferase
VATLYVVAGGSAVPAAILATGMLGLQFSIGATNDLADEAADAMTQPTKPLPAGYLGRRTALLVAVLAAGAGLAIYAAWGLLILGLAVAMLGCGIAYDLGLKRAGLGWLCWAIAFPLLPVSTWLAAAGEIPPRSELLVPIACLAGPMLQLSNGIVDVERDAAAGIRGPAVRLGRRRAVAVLGGLVALVYGTAWITLIAVGAPAPSLAAAGLASCCGVIGVALAGRRDPGTRERGWQAEAAGLALLAAAWLAAVA